VLKQYYGAGISNGLIDCAIETADLHQSVWLWLCVSDKNHRAQRFYQKLHFEKIGKGPVLIVGQDKLNSSILALKLSGLSSED
jgi:ribosomal protein S18 acetylase RimI-like enzyme